MADSEPTVQLRKAAGGATLTYEGKSYTWKTDGAVVTVPYAFAMTLTGIPDAGYSVAGDPASEAAAVTPPPADLSRRDASPVTPKAKGATVTPPAPEPPAPAEEPAAGKES